MMVIEFVIFCLSNNFRNNSRDKKYESLTLLLYFKEKVKNIITLLNIISLDRCSIPINLFSSRNLLVEHL